MGATTPHADVEGSAEELPDEPGTDLTVAAPAAIGRVIGTDDPDEMLRTVGTLATSLKKFVDEKRLAVDMGGGRKHVEVGAWQALGHLLGTLGGTPVHAETVWTRPMAAPNGEVPRVDFKMLVKRWHKKSEGGGIKSETTYDVRGIEAWEACVQVCTADGTVVGRAEAMCSRLEETWARRDDYALRSMAETRAESRAFRRALGFFMEAAGYSPTPREEMPPQEAGTVELPAWVSSIDRAETTRLRRALAFLLDDEPNGQRVEQVGFEVTEACGGIIPRAVHGAIRTLAVVRKRYADSLARSEPRPADEQEAAAAALATEHGDGEPEPTPEEIAAARQTFPDDDIPF